MAHIHHRQSPSSSTCGECSEFAFDALGSLVQRRVLLEADGRANSATAPERKRFPGFGNSPVFRTGFRERDDGTIHEMHTPYQSSGQRQSRLMLLARERLDSRVIGPRYSGRLIRRQRFGALARPPSPWWARDPQLLHLVGERRPLESQASCRSTSTSDNPIAFAERLHDLLSLGLLERIAPVSPAEA
jgi:hypothetical protein